MRFWQWSCVASLLLPGVACGGSDNSASNLLASGNDASSADATSNDDGVGGASGGTAGTSSAGGSSGSHAGSAGAGGILVVDASEPTDANGPKKDGGRTGADGGCTQ